MAGDAHIPSEYRFITVSYGKPTKITLSSNGINRINFAEQRVVQIVGESQKFTKLLTSHGADLFLTSKLSGEAGCENISVVLSDGRVIDFVIKIEKSDVPTIIKFNFSSLVFQRHEMVLAASKMIRAMREERVGKYYVQDVDKHFKLPELLAGVGVQVVANYRYLKLAGVVLKVTPSNGGIEISENDFHQMFEKVISTRIGKTQGVGTRGVPVRISKPEFVYVVYERSEE